MIKLTSRIDEDSVAIEARKAEEKAIKQLATKVNKLKNYINLSDEMVRELQGNIPDSISTFSTIRKGIIKWRANSLMDYSEKISKLAREIRKLSAV